MKYPFDVEKMRGQSLRELINDPPKPPFLWIAMMFAVFGFMGVCVLPSGLPL
jgi:hypothetical protein